jgi:hypothetical protein
MPPIWAWAPAFMSRKNVSPTVSPAAGSFIPSGILKVSLLVWSNFTTDFIGVGIMPGNVGGADGMMDAVSFWAFTFTYQPSLPTTPVATSSSLESCLDGM